MRRFQKLTAALMALMMLFSAASALAAPGTAQYLRVEYLDDENYDSPLYHMEENVDGFLHDFIVYCFNNEKYWPVDTWDYAMQELFVPDALIHLSEAVKDKLYRVMYAGYPADNLGLIEAAGESYHDYNWINENVEVTASALEMFPQLQGIDLTLYDNPANYGVQDINSPQFVIVCAVIDQLESWAYSFDDELTAKYHKFILENRRLYALLDALYNMVNYDMPEVENIEDWFDGHINQHGHYATQVAIWRILHENNVPGNGKSEEEAMHSDSLVKKLVDFANGVGEYANVTVPPRSTTFT
ncbi:MAG: thioester domain-containing protein [Clostridia bacterium]|nr:thioester domain-containing protein [Clostridia bacterium]